jgi:hypothetical protein
MPLINLFYPYLEHSEENRLVCFNALYPQGEFGLVSGRL